MIRDYLLNTESFQAEREPEKNLLFQEFLHDPITPEENDGFLMGLVAESLHCFCCWYTTIW